MSISYKAIVNGKHLCHMNTHHDPKNGRFTTAPGGVSSAHNPSGWVGNKYDGNTKKATNSGKSKGSINYEKGLSKTSEALGKAGKNMQNLRFHNKKGEKTDLSQYSDQELQRIINRARNEAEYDRLFNPAMETKGQKFVKGLGTGLTIASLVVGIVGGAAGAYSGFTGKPVGDLFKKKS